MSLSSKLLPILALTLAFPPLEVHAHTKLAPGSAQHYADSLQSRRGAAHKEIRASNVTPSSDTIDNPTTIFGGVDCNAFRDSVGG